jgi:hypothetical protein
VTVEQSDGWWLAQLWGKLAPQRERCQLLQDRYIGDAPLPNITDNQSDAVKWFVAKSRSNFERLIVNSVLSRLKIRGIRTAVDSDEGGDAAAFKVWKRARGKLVVLDAHKMALAMSRSYVIVGKDQFGKLVATAEDPRQVTAITDPLDPFRCLAGIKVFEDHNAKEEVCYLYLPGRAPRIARRPLPRNGTIPIMDGRFPAQAFTWDDERDDAPVPGFVDWLAARDGMPAAVPIVPFKNEDGMAQFEPFLPLIDRINQQILQRMTIATIQAFKQRAFKGLPEKDPKTGKKIDWDAVFVAEPGAVWNVPASVDIWESGQADLGPILNAIRDDVKDLAATSGTPLYSITPDAAQGSAEGASLQREQMVFQVQTRQDRWELGHEMICELMFRTAGDNERAQPGTIEIMWAPVQQFSMAERASAISQTKDVMSKYQQLTEIWGMDPAQADRNMSELADDQVLAQQMAAAATAAQAAAAPPPVQVESQRADQPAERGQGALPAGAGVNGRDEPAAAATRR